MSNEQLQQRLEMLEAKIDLLYSSGNIPHDVEQAFRTRLQYERVDTLASISTSSKGATSENQAVNSYSVLKAPDAFIEITISGAVKYVPIYT